VSDVTNDDEKRSALFYMEIIEMRNEITMIQVISKRKSIVQCNTLNVTRKREKERERESKYCKIYSSWMYNAT